MNPRIYTAAEARALLDGTTPGPWSAEYDIGATLYLTQSSDPHEDIATYLDATDANARLMAAAPDLAASVEHHARRAEKAEAERDALRAAVREYLTARDAWEEWQDGGREGGPSADARVSFARASAALRALLPEVTP